MKHVALNQSLLFGRLWSFLVLVNDIRVRGIALKIYPFSFILCLLTILSFILNLCLTQTLQGLTFFAIQLTQMKKILFLFFFLVAGNSIAQHTGAIKGNIVDLEMGNDPLLLAQVSIKNTALHTQTNFHGNFEISNIDSGRYILTICYLGYETLEMPIVIKENGVAKINGGLGAMRISLDDVAGLNSVAKEGIGTILSSEKSLRP